MNHDQMSRRCPDAKFIKPLYLRGWQLEMFCHATIGPKKGASVAGALWSISESDLYNLDCYEGTPIYYRRRRWKQDGEEFFFYEMNDPRSGSPSLGYVEDIRQGYLDCGLDPKVLDNYLTNFKKNHKLNYESRIA
jgi:gamma-glutamylcyclotransferase (GGCT)/AIG2-like uncharacterized protein YtfP